MIKHPSRGAMQKESNGRVSYRFGAMSASVILYRASCEMIRPVRFNLHLSMHFIEPEALAEPRRRKSASASGSVSSQLISIVQVEMIWLV